MRFFLRWILIGLPLTWPAIGQAQFLKEKPSPAGGDAVGAWMADSTAMPIWVSAAMLGLVSDPSINGIVSGTLKLDASSDAYEADYVTSTHVKLSIPLLNQSIDSTFVDSVREAGVYSVAGANLILAPAVPEGETAVSDTLGFSARDDSLFLIESVTLPAQYAGMLAQFRLEAPLAILGFAKVDEEPAPPEPPTDPDPPVSVIAADFNGDGNVDFSDFIAFAQNFGRSDGDENYDAKFDLTGDDRVDFADFIAFAQQFGQ